MFEQRLNHNQASDIKSDDSDSDSETIYYDPDNEYDGESIGDDSVNNDNDDDGSDDIESEINNRCINSILPILIAISLSQPPENIPEETQTETETGTAAGNEEETSNESTEEDEQFLTPSSSQINLKESQSPTNVVNTHIDSFKQELKELDSTIGKVNDHSIKHQAIETRNRLIAAHESNLDDTHLAQHLYLTNQLLNSVPGEKRDRLATQYMDLATKTKTSRSLLCQALGMAMILLGTMITALSVASIITTGFAAPAAVIGAAAGVGLLAAGIGLFAYGRPRQDTAMEMMNPHLNIINDKNG